MGNVKAVLTVKDVDMRVADAAMNWLQEGRVIAKEHSGHQWLVADWLLRGEIDERVYKKTMYADAATIFQPYSPKTLKEWAYVARSIQRPFRMDGLSFGHHQVVAALAPPEQERWLKKAKESALTVKALRDAVAAERKATAGVEVHFPTDLLEELKVRAGQLNQTVEALAIAAVSQLVEQDLDAITNQQRANAEARYARNHNPERFDTEVEKRARALFNEEVRKKAEETYTHAVINAEVTKRFEEKVVWHLVELCQRDGAIAAAHRRFDKKVEALFREMYPSKEAIAAEVERRHEAAQEEEEAEAEPTEQQTAEYQGGL